LINIKGNFGFSIVKARVFQNILVKFYRNSQHSRMWLNNNRLTV